jgi:agmatine deiminase
MLSIRTLIRQAGIVFSVCIPIHLSAQQALPNGFAPGEQQKMKEYLSSIPFADRGTTIVKPPASPVRTAAEWEEIQALTITWTDYTSVLTDVVKAAQSECLVYIVCSDSASVKNSLSSAGIPLTNIRCIKAAYDAIWIRDYGQNTVYTNDVDSLILVDWIYNRPRPNDDVVPTKVAARLGLPLYSTTSSPYNLTHTGGNFMSDGFGTAFSSELILDENSGKTSSQIDDIMKKFMGINRYIKMETLPYDGIHHIDMHMKLLDEETLLVGQYPKGVADGPQIEANLQYVLSNYKSVFGTPYKVVRIPMPPDGSSYPDNGGDYMTYANAVFVNKTVIMPNYKNKYDTTAIRIMKESLPAGYKVVGVDCRNPIQASGAIHCITNSVGVHNPMLISHQPLANTSNAIQPYTVTARIQNRSGIKTATIYYKTSVNGAYQTASMSLSNTNSWTGDIPAQAPGTKVYYYIQAEANNGKKQVRPLTAPQGYWNFTVTGIPTGLASATSFLPEMKPAYPNPSKGITCIPLVTAKSTHGSIQLMDILGNEVIQIFNGEIPAGEKNYFVDTTPLSAGVYHIVVKTAEASFQQKLMVR